MCKVKLYLSKPMNMEKICIFCTNAETIVTNSKISLYSLNNVSYLVLVGSAVLREVCQWGLTPVPGIFEGEWTLKEEDAQKQSLAASCLCMAVSVSLPLRLSGIWLALGDAASFSFPVVELMRFSSPLFGKQCCFSVWFLILALVLGL